LFKFCKISKPRNQFVPIKSTNLLNICEDEEVIEDVTYYQSIIGQLLYISRLSRPDITIAVNQLSRFNQKPKPTHLKYAYQVVEYLNHTKNLSIKFKRSTKSSNEIVRLHTYTDSDFANDINDRKAFSGFCTYLDRFIISWNSIKQTIVAQSANEAEIIAANEALRQHLYLKNMINELILSKTVNIESKLFSDNNGVIKFCKRGIGQRTKHLDLRLKLIYDHYNKKTIDVERVSSKENQADLFTKFVTKTDFQHLRPKLNLRYTK
jgi:hypothetical protein